VSAQTGARTYVINFSQNEGGTENVSLVKKVVVARPCRTIQKHRQIINPIIPILSRELLDPVIYTQYNTLSYS